MKMMLLQLLQISIMIGKHDRHTILVPVFIADHARSTREGTFSLVCVILPTVGRGGGEYPVQGEGWIGYVLPRSYLRGGEGLP